MGSLFVNCTWRRLVTLACLGAFIFVVSVHSGHHVSPASDKIAFSAVSIAPIDGHDDGDSTQETGCLLCALALDVITLDGIIPFATAHGVVETSLLELKARLLPAENPPPIA